MFPINKNGIKNTVSGGCSEELALRASDHGKKRALSVWITPSEGSPEVSPLAGCACRLQVKGINDSLIKSGKIIPSSPNYSLIGPPGCYCSIENGN